MPGRYRRKPKPARTQEEREDYMVSIAEELAEKQILDGTASAQVITHYLKTGNSRERLEKARIEADVRLAEIKAQREESAQHREELYAEALAAMRTYSGTEVEEYDPD